MISSSGRHAVSNGTRLTLLVIYCADLLGCRDFYAALGLPFAQEQHNGGPAHYAATLPDGVVLELYPASARRPVSTPRLGLSVDGATLRPPLAPGRHLLRDPDGRTVEVHAR